MISTLKPLILAFNLLSYEIKAYGENEFLYYDSNRLRILQKESSTFFMGFCMLFFSELHGLLKKIENTRGITEGKDKLTKLVKLSSVLKI